MRRPLSARAILKEAYSRRIVPKHLYGATQHKTLNARISEDILKNRESPFIRTQPGRFFLKNFVVNEGSFVNHPAPYVARRRRRDLFRGRALSIKSSFLEEYSGIYTSWRTIFEDFESKSAINYIRRNEVDDHHVLCWSFPVVMRKTEILTYRIGRYRQLTNSDLAKRTIGFPGLICAEDLTLFSRSDYGAAEAGLTSVIYDLGLAGGSLGRGVADIYPNLHSVGVATLPKPALFFVMIWRCPDWFELTSRRLSLNDPIWIDKDRLPNDIGDFEPWSQMVLCDMHDLRLD